MIGNMAVRVTADRPNFPLGTLFVRAGSAANIALVGVPVRPGVDVTALALRVENVDGATADYAARAIGGVWVVDVPASHFATVGSVTGGVSVWATGTGADGETPRTWCVGVGDLEVLPADADAPAPAPGQTFWPLRMFDAAPTTPTKYNAYIDGAALKIWNGVAWITISGGSGTVDDTVTRTSANPVKSSGIWGAIWGALTALPEGVASLYDWCVAQLAGKLSTSGETYTFGESLGGLFVGVGSNDMYEFSPADLGGANTIARRKDLAGKYEKPSGGIPASDLAQAVQTALAAIPGKAAAADLRYRIAEAAVRKTLPADCFPVTFTYDGVSYSVNSLVKESEASAAGDMYIKVDETDYFLMIVESPATESETMNAFVVAIFDAGGVYTTGVPDLQFGGVSPVEDTSPTLANIQIPADRTVNLITATDETSIDIELPEAVTVDGVRYARDFLLDIDNSANASDLALEFTALGMNYVFIADKDDTIGEMMTIAGYGTGSSGDGERVRLYFTETPLFYEDAEAEKPVIHVARVTLGDFVTSTATQGGN